MQVSWHFNFRRVRLWAEYPPKSAWILDFYGAINRFCCCFSFSRFVYLFERLSYRGGREIQKDVLSTSSLVTWPQEPELGQETARSQKFLPDSYTGDKGPSTCTMFCCFPRFIIRELDPKWSNWDTNTHLPGMWAPQTMTSAVMLQHCNLTGILNLLVCDDLLHNKRILVHRKIHLPARLIKNK